MSSAPSLAPGTPGQLPGEGQRGGRSNQLRMRRPGLPGLQPGLPGFLPRLCPFLKAVTLSKSLNLSEGSVCFDPRSLCRAGHKRDA